MHGVITNFSVILQCFNPLYLLTKEDSISLYTLYIFQLIKIFNILNYDLFIGFICPIHTPDGAPCGLLNHLTMNCIITKHADPKLKAAIPAVLIDLGMIPLFIADWKNSYNVMLDGKLIGLIEDKIINKVVYKLRLLKIKGREVSYERNASWGAILMSLRSFFTI